MADTRGERPAVRRQSMVCVEIPPSPLHTARASTGRKENSLLRFSQTISNATSASQKRKLDAEANQPFIKKLKQAQARAIDNLEENRVPDTNSVGFVYCHQCNMQRDISDSVQCTALDENGHRCRAKYCESCLAKRYGLDLEDILANTKAPSRLYPPHVHGEGYFFTCPLCDGICSCIVCRHARGLQPTGNTNLVTSQPGLGRPADVTRQDSKTVVIHKEKAHKSAPPPPLAIRPKADGNAKQSISLASKYPKPKPKRISLPTWTDLDVSLSLAEVEQRIHIREFALRFSSVINISRIHLDELEEIKSYRSDEESELVPWISEGCVKSLTLGLLNMLNVEGEDAKRLDSVTKSVKASGSKLNSIWCALSTLGGSSTSLPSPLPPPTSVNMIKTRSGANQAHTSDINVIRTAQLVPVISALVDKAIQSQAAKQELDSGVDEAKERTKEAREAHRMENERFDRLKEQDPKRDRTRTDHHKQIVADIGDALRVVLKGYVTRVSPLGRDMDGRTYWALSPGIKETEAAISYLASSSRENKAASSKAKRSRTVPSEEDRKAMKKWSWFLAVWGPAPPVSERTRLEGSDDEGDADEKWWGFWDPKEITKLANWIRSKSDLDDALESSASSRQKPSTLGNTQDDLSEVEDVEMAINAMPTRNEIGSLVKELEQYAALLKYRTKRDESGATSRG